MYLICLSFHPRSHPVPHRPKQQRTVPEEQHSHQYWSQHRCCCCVHCGASCCYDNSNRCMCQLVYSRQLKLLYTLDSALRCPLIAVPASPPTHIYNSYILQCIRLLQLQLVLLQLLPFICLSGVPLLYTTVPPTPPAVWPTPRTPGAAFPAGTMPHTLTAVATAPTSCVGGDYSCVVGDYRQSSMKG